VTESKPGAVAVIDQAGRHHHFDADDWLVDLKGYLHVTKDGKNDDPVAFFTPGFLGVYRVSARAAAPVTVIGSPRTAAASAAIETLRREVEAAPSGEGKAGDAL
jgi:hypothetical protein